jgi:type I restriction enzyme M protein
MTQSRTDRAALAAAIKSARNVMRKDAGLSGDLDRTPQLSWLLFLKALDDLEQSRKLTERRSYRETIEEPYRWRDWAGDTDDRRTGEELIEFVDRELLPHLQQLRGTGDDDPRDVVAAVFKDTRNRMVSGYLLREVIEIVDRVDFASTDDIHTMAHLYESMLREMRDAAGDSGEFYTPRPIIRFIVERLEPQLGESILDPAAGTCGFLIEALDQIRPQTAAQQRALHRNLRGIEKKPLPFLLGTMNLLLHGVDRPHVEHMNALATPLTQIGRSAQVDVIATNPPFGGEEETGIQACFPPATRTSETALLFLQVIQRLLKPGGRCGVIVPNGVLFGEGVATRVKEQLLKRCDLHTIVRLPPGVFAPYTPIPTNVLFFERTGATREVWFYEQPPPEGRKGYTKTRPLPHDDLADCATWWGGRNRAGREENDRAWRVSVADIEADGFNLDLRNPHRPDDLSHRPPAELVAELVKVEREIAVLLNELTTELTT